MHRHPELLRAAGTAVLVRTAADLVDEVDRLLLDPVRARGIGAAGRRTVERNRGASERTFRHVEKLATGGLTT